MIDDNEQVFVIEMLKSGVDYGVVVHEQDNPTILEIGRYSTLRGAEMAYSLITARIRQDYFNLELCTVAVGHKRAIYTNAQIVFTPEEK